MNIECWHDEKPTGQIFFYIKLDGSVFWANLCASVNGMAKYSILQYSQSTRRH